MPEILPNSGRGVLEKGGEGRNTASIVDNLAQLPAAVDIGDQAAPDQDILDYLNISSSE